MSASDGERRHRQGLDERTRSRSHGQRARRSACCAARHTRAVERIRASGAQRRRGRGGRAPLAPTAGARAENACRDAHAGRARRTAHGQLARRGHEPARCWRRRWWTPHNARAAAARRQPSARRRRADQRRRSFEFCPPLAHGLDELPSSATTSDEIGSDDEDRDDLATSRARRRGGRMSSTIANAHRRRPRSPTTARAIRGACSRTTEAPAR